MRLFQSKENASNWKEWFGFRSIKPLKEILLFTAGLSLLSFKYLVLAIPFFSVNLASQLVNIEDRRIISIFSIFALIFILANLSDRYPDQNQINAVQYTLALDKNIQNDWGLGHYVVFFGGTPSNRWGPPVKSADPNMDFNFMTYFDCDQRPVLTSYDLNQDWVKLNNFGVYKIYRCRRTA